MCVFSDLDKATEILKKKKSQVEITNNQKFSFSVVRERVKYATLWNAIVIKIVVGKNVVDSLLKMYRGIVKKRKEKETFPLQKCKGKVCFSFS